MATRALLDLQVYCPWSGAVLDGRRIKPHKLQVMRCSNGTLFSICTVHRCRTFTADWNLVATVNKTVSVLDITQKPLREKNRGIKHAP